MNPNSDRRTSQWPRPSRPDPYEKQREEAEARPADPTLCGNAMEKAILEEKGTIKRGRVNDMVEPFIGRRES